MQRPTKEQLNNADEAVRVYIDKLEEAVIIARVEVALAAHHIGAGNYDVAKSRANNALDVLPERVK